ncbi:MAG: RluA family pseudouridine synthase [Planctomycetota bacterium]
MIDIVLYGGPYLVVDKPAGLACTAPPDCPSVQSILRKQLRDRTPYVSVVHRLDRPVSGLLLVGLTKRATRLLSEQFAVGKVLKRYQAELFGQPSMVGLAESPNGSADPFETRWEDWLCKRENEPLVDVVEAPGDGLNLEAEPICCAKRAITHVRLISENASAGRFTLELRPITGRMHQLRVQAAHRGCPIVGDSLYDRRMAAKGHSTSAGAPEEICLRATGLTFFDPNTAKQIESKATERVEFRM